MSAGDNRFDDKPAPLARLRAIMLKYPAIGRRLRRWRQVCHGFDIPYLGGISQNGLYVYLDRHLPAKLGKKNTPVAKIIEVHESVEEALHWEAVQNEELYKYLVESDSKYPESTPALYEACHHLATAAEQYAMISEGYDWDEYESALRTDYPPIEHEDIVRVPPDIATFQYSGKLLEHIERVAAKSHFEKDEVRYREGGMLKKCGNCAMFLPRLGRCTWVEGTIEADYVCDKFEVRQL